MTEVLRKVRFYLANGVRLVWLIDPERRTVTVFTDPEQSRILTDEDTLEGGDVLPGFECAVAQFLPPLDGIGGGANPAAPGEATVTR